MTPTLNVPENIKFSETRQANGKRMHVYFTSDETAAFQFAREHNGYHYKFLPDSYRILIPIEKIDSH